MSETILLIDLSSIVHQLWHVSGKEPDPDWTSKSAVAKVHALASAHKHAAVCCDSRKSLRKDLDPTYKANRPAQEEPLRHQMALAIDLLKLDGFPCWMADGYEADDIIATATRCVRAMDDDALIASADKDLLQLVGPHVTVHSTTSGNRVDEAAVVEKFGVRPDQILDYLCLVGDSSDNVKGAEGIGPKKAAQILATFGTLEACYAAIDKADARLSNGMEQSLLEFRPRWVGVRELLRLRDDAPVPFEEIAAERVPAVKADALFDTAFEVDPATLTGKKSKPPVGQVLPPPEPVQAELPPTNDAQFREPATHAVSAPAGAGAVVGHVPAVVHSSVEWDRQLEPVDLRQAHELSKALHASRLFLAYGAPEAILATVIAGRELGLPAMAALRAFHIIEGKAVPSAALIVALALRSAKVDYIRCVERTPERASYVARRTGDPEVAMSYSVEEARKAWTKDPKKFGESGWGRNPADMCVARCSSKIARLIAPDVVGGLYGNEEFD